MGKHTNSARQKASCRSCDSRLMTPYSGRLPCMPDYLPDRAIISRDWRSSSAISRPSASVCAAYLPCFQFAIAAAPPCMRHRPYSPLGIFMPGARHISKAWPALKWRGMAPHLGESVGIARQIAVSEGPGLHGFEDFLHFSCLPPPPAFTAPTMAWPPAFTWTCSTRTVCWPRPRWRFNASDCCEKVRSSFATRFR